MSRLWNSVASRSRISNDVRSPIIAHAGVGRWCAGSWCGIECPVWMDVGGGRREAAATAVREASNGGERCAVQHRQYPFNLWRWRFQSARASGRPSQPTRRILLRGAVREDSMATAMAMKQAERSEDCREEENGRKGSVKRSEDWRSRCLPTGMTSANCMRPGGFPQPMIELGDVPVRRLCMYVLLSLSQRLTPRGPCMRFLDSISSNSVLQPGASLGLLSFHGSAQLHSGSLAA